MPSISYDPEVQILSIRLKRVKSVDSEIKGNVVLDYDAKGQLTNIDVMNVNLEDVNSLPSIKK
jgi:uncharacterized protein YuzE